MPPFLMIDQVLIDEEKWLDFWEYFTGTEGQKEGVLTLYKHLKLASPTLLANNAEWIDQYRGGGSQPPPAPPTEGIATPDLMSRLTGYPASSFDDVFCNDCNRLFKDTGFDKHLDAMQMLMANMMHETCNFVYMKEIADGWAYDMRRDLGNDVPGDGPKYKGAGVLQLTGKYNYQRLADGIGDARVMEGVDYVADTYPFTSARIWIEENDLLSVCLNNGFDECCRRINGGWNGYDDRLAKYKICQREMQ